MKLLRSSLVLLLLAAAAAGCEDEEDDGAVPNGVSVEPAAPVEPYGGLDPAGSTVAGEASPATAGAASVMPVGTADTLAPPAVPDTTL